MTTFGLTETGFIIKRLADIKTEMEARFISAFGPAFNLESESPAGQFIGIVSEMMANDWEEMQLVYNAFSPDTANGVSLDGVGTLTNAIRLSATSSQVTLAITGTPGIAIPATFKASVVGNPTAIFQALNSGAIPGGGVLSLAMQATTTGPVTAPAGTLTIIVTPISGVASVTNAADAVVGRNTETDDQFRIRRLQSLARPGSATINGLLNAILNVANVLQAAIIENASDLIDIYGRPPHSFEAVVSGGTDADIASAIFGSKAAGIQTFGSTSESVVDSQGISHTIKFNRPSAVSISLEITVTRNLDPNEGDVYPSNGDDAIKAAVIAYTGAAGVLGREVVLSKFYTPINTIPGVFGISIRVSSDGGSTWQSINMVIAPDAMPEFDISRITVVHA